MSHFRNNVKDHLKAREDSSTTEITNQIFGYHLDGVYHEGLVDAESSEMFDSLFESVRTKWEEKSPSFVRWFATTTTMIKETMLPKVRTAAGLGCPPPKKKVLHSLLREQ
ncbi:unnamed protein product [Porites evermanni]|uniref:Uncharacterized protein n=1 Tax=Porites evermanni TaxID=104178 RepID=A0ABN8R2D1_9CNID|nr:unnamed protein product [Porites evermanni]